MKWNQLHVLVAGCDSKSPPFPRVCKQCTSLNLTSVSVKWHVTCINIKPFKHRGQMSDRRQTADHATKQCVAIGRIACAVKSDFA